jgi:hypothetical protein
MAPDISKIDTDRHPDPGTSARNFRDNVIRRLLHGKQSLPSGGPAHPIYRYRSDVDEYWRFTNCGEPIHAIRPSCMSWKHEKKAGLCGPRFVCDQSALAGIGERPKDRTGVFVHDLTKIHRDGEQEDQKEEVDAKE